MKILALIAMTLAGAAVAGAVLADTAPQEAALITAARSQVGVTVIYDGAYVALDFPGGDLDRSRGVCTDVVIRAMREAWDIDLQLVVNRDMKRAFAAYPKLWGLRTTDRNIDHRRVPNLQVFLLRMGAEIAAASDPADHLPGDIVSWRLPGNLPHIGIISDRLSDDGFRPLVLHDVGAGAQEEDALFSWPVTGHYRVGAEARQRITALTR